MFDESLARGLSLLHVCVISFYGTSAASSYTFRLIPALSRAHFSHTGTTNTHTTTLLHTYSLRRDVVALTSEVSFCNDKRDTGYERYTPRSLLLANVELCVSLREHVRWCVAWLTSNCCAKPRRVTKAVVTKDSQRINSHRIQSASPSFPHPSSHAIKSGQLIWVNQARLKSSDHRFNSTIVKRFSSRRVESHQRTSREKHNLTLYA